MTTYPYNKVHGANMGPNWVLSARDGPMNLFFKVDMLFHCLMITEWIILITYFMDFMDTLR